MAPGEVLVRGDRIVEVGSSVAHPAGAETIDLGDRTLMPGLIDAHVHLFLHPGAEDLQTVEESVPQRTILATLAARDDLMAGFTAERDMGTEGAGAADTAVRNAIDQGLIPGPRLRISGNAIDILGGHEDANRFNPAQHVLSNADYANNALETGDRDPRAVQGRRRFHQDLRDRPRLRSWTASFSTPYQYTRSRAGSRGPRKPRASASAWRCTLPANQERCMPRRPALISIDHAYQLSEETMRLMREKRHLRGSDLHHLRVLRRARRDAGPGAAATANRCELHAARISQTAGGRACQFAMGSDVGPFPHGTQAREFVLMVKYGMTPLAAVAGRHAQWRETARLGRTDRRT